MSRVGMMPIELPAKVTAAVDDANEVTVKGPLGELRQKVAPEITVNISGDTITLARAGGSKKVRALHGLFRSLLANMVMGVSEGFERHLEIQGVGYRADQDGARLTLRMGFSHDVIIEPLPGVELSTEGNQVVVVRGADKQAVGQMAATIRAVRPVEPYKGKGIRYRGERVRRKSGKAAKVGA